MWLASLYKGDMHIGRMHRGRMSCEDEGRDQVMLLQAKKCQGWLVNHQKVGVLHGTDFP